LNNTVTLKSGLEVT